MPESHLKLLNKANFVLGILSSLGLSIVANFQVNTNSVDVQTLYVICGGSMLVHVLFPYNGINGHR